MSDFSLSLLLIFGVYALAVGATDSARFGGFGVALGAFCLTIFTGLVR